MDTVIERLMHFHSFLQKEYGYQGRNWLESELGLSSGSLTRALKRKSSISSDLLYKVFEVFPFLSMKWLIKGEGEMLVTDRGLRLRLIRINRGYSTSEFAGMLHCTEYFYLRMESGEIPLSEDYKQALLYLGVKEDEIPFNKYDDTLQWDENEFVGLTTNDIPSDYNKLVDEYDNLVSRYDKLTHQYDELKERYNAAIAKIGELILKVG